MFLAEPRVSRLPPADWCRFCKSFSEEFLARCLLLFQHPQPEQEQRKEAPLAGRIKFSAVVLAW